MKEVALDDLIKEDREKKQHTRKNIQNRNNGRNRNDTVNNRNGPPNHKFINRNNPRFNRNRDNRNGRPIFNNANHSNRPTHVQNANRFQERDNRQQIRRNDKPSKQVQKIQRDEDSPGQKERTLKVMGLHPDFTNQDLHKLFAAKGALQKCVIEQDNFGRSMTTAIVRYHSTQSAKNAIADLNQHKVMNSILTVEPYKRKPNK